MRNFFPNDREELSNTLTHLIGIVFTLASAWIVWPAFHLGWRWAMGVLFFLVGMLLMYTSSTIYHWVHPGAAKRVMRKLDHISIYVMIACSYTPVCIAVVGGWVGWTVFGILWGVALGGTFYKIFALGRFPRLSLALYLVMGWSGLFIARDVYQAMPLSSLLCIAAEGLFYTAGTYFFSHDDRRAHFHATWHVFVLLGSIFHWVAIMLVMFAFMK